MTNLNTPFMIGNVEIPNRTVLAPMAGVTNSAFRTIAKELGAGLVVMEMVSDKGIQYNNEKTLHMLHIDEGENPVSIQLFGSDEDSLARAAEFIQENTKTDIVDINICLLYTSLHVFLVLEFSSNGELSKESGLLFIESRKNINSNLINL